MSVYLIDFENVHYDGLSGILKLTPEDQVYIFYSDNGKRLTFELHEQINNSPAQFYYYKAVVGGKNALDHQLSSYLGFLIGKTGDKEKEYYIVSKDRGYRHLMAFWNSANMGLAIHLVDSIRISRLSDEDRAQEEQAKEEKAEEEKAEEEKAAEKQASQKSASRRRGRVVKAKPQAEPDVPALGQEVKEDKTIAVDKKDDVAKQPKAKQRRTAKKQPAEITKEQEKDQPTKPEQNPKEPPKIVEFVLPEDIVSTTRYSVTAPKVENSSVANKPVVNTNAKAKTAKPKTNKVKKTDDVKKVQTETVPHLQEGIKEDDIVKLIPEAKEQPWLGDIIRYVNSSKGKAQLYNAIRRRLGQDEGRKIYNIIKKLV